MSLLQFIIDFCGDVIRNHESKLYKSYAVDKRVDLTKAEFKEYITIFIFGYINAIYFSLIRKDNPQLVKKFEAMKKIHKHSMCCLLELTRQILVVLYDCLPRCKLDIKSYETYMNSVTLCLNIIKGICFKHFSKVPSFQHQCEEIDFDQCDPNQPLFDLAIVPK